MSGTSGKIIGIALLLVGVYLVVKNFKVVKSIV